MLPPAPGSIANQKRVGPVAVVLVLCPREEFRNDLPLPFVDEGADVHAEREGAGIVEGDG